MKQHYDGTQILGGRYIQREIWRHVRPSITYLVRGLEGIAAVTQLGELVVPHDEVRGDQASNELAFDFYFGCGFFLGSGAFQVVGKFQAQISGV